MYQYYISVGISAEYDYNNISKAVEKLRNFKATKLLHSDFYISERRVLDAKKSSKKYISLCVNMDSDYDPFEFSEKLKKLERKFPKVYINIIWIKNIEIISNLLRVPDYNVLKTGYTLLPLQEIVKTDKKLLEIIKSNIDLIGNESKKISKYSLKRM